LWDVFIINSVEQLQTLPKTQSEIDISPFLKRMRKYLNRLGKLTIYYSFILSNFNYCPVIRHFCSEANTKKMVKIQGRPLKFIYNENHSTYEELLAK
jgi:hypothetical protein